MQRRSGMTLVEVLVAIFVMGIGMLALLTLFPIGMLRMARAIHDERSAQSAQNAQSIAVMYGLGQDLDVSTDSAGTFNAGVAYDVFNNTSPRHPATGVPNYLLNADPYSESYPILVDPIGFYNVTGLAQHWVGGSVPTTNVNVAAAPHQGGLRRRPAEFVRNGLALPAQIIDRNKRILSSFTLWDDLVFENDLAVGAPGGPKINATTVLRDPRFSWGYTMQRPMASDKSVVNCSIVIFDKRSLSITGNGALAEHVYPNITFFNSNTNSIIIDITNPAVVPPPLRPGDWIMDVTPYNPTATSGSSHAYWYRVIAAEDVTDGVSKFAKYEVQQPIRGRFPGAPVTTASGVTLGFQGTSIVMEGVAEVFEKGPIRLP
jgi:prepilin-type N-terminal cleavage/methylation domain-containing protein